MLNKKSQPKSKRKGKTINFLSAPQPPSNPHLIASNGTNVDDVEWNNIDRARTVSLSTSPSKKRRLSTPDGLP